ncbi:MAG: hypothetical protein DCF22_00615 [Leptolyngbya sp.]|nr:MAG: hypothetical protein DCF22_00615 [Leptolyngbya sp.]
MSDSSIVELLSRKKRDVDKIVDITFFRMLEEVSAIASIFPITNYVDREILLLKFKHNRPTIGSIVAEDQDIPATRPRSELREELFSNLKIGKKLLFLERDFELMFKMKTYLGMTGAVQTQVAAEIEKHFFGLTADLVPSVIEKLTVLAFQVATTGACIYTDPLTNARVALTYPGTLATLLPAALTGNARWSQPATATPLTNLEGHATAHYDVLGSFPQKIIMRWSNLRQVANSVEAKTAVMRRSGADSTTPDTTASYITDALATDLILERTRAKELILFDAQYSEESASGVITDKYYLDDNTYLFARDGQFERAFVPTVEKDFASGIFFVAEQTSKSPRREHAIAVGNGIPFVSDDRYIAARKVA